MKKTSKSTFYNDYLQFFIEKPDDWEFVPQQWADNFRERRFETNPELKEKFQNTAVPFVYFYKPHEEPEYPLPTVQCGCRLNNLPTEYSYEEYLENVLKLLPKCYSKLKVIEANTNFILSGHRSIFIRIKFIMNNLDNQPIWCLGRLITTFTSNIIYNMGLTGSLEGKYCYEDTFTQVIHSIKLGNKYLRVK